MNKMSLFLLLTLCALVPTKTTTSSRGERYKNRINQKPTIIIGTVHGKTRIFENIESYLKAIEQPTPEPVPVYSIKIDGKTHFFPTKLAAAIAKAKEKNEIEGGTGYFPIYPDISRLSLTEKGIKFLEEKVIRPNNLSENYLKSIAQQFVQTYN